VAAKAHLASRNIPTSTTLRVPILLAVDRELCELADPVGAVEVQEHEDVEQFGALPTSAATRMYTRSSVVRIER
jgi:hypothetical protein